MQEASAQTYQSIYLPKRKVFHSFSKLRISPKRLLCLIVENPGATPYELLALLLLLLVPLVFTLQKLVLLPVIGDRSHQVEALNEFIVKNLYLQLFRETLILFSIRFHDCFNQSCFGRDQFAPFLNDAFIET